MRKKHRNKLISRVRARVEKVFGTLKPSYGYRRVRYTGLERNATEMWFKSMACNLPPEIPFPIRGRNLA